MHLSLNARIAAIAIVLSSCCCATTLHAQPKQAKAKQTKQTKAKQKRAPNAAMARIEDDPNLPRVLLIGDSISIGYTVPVREMLKGKANVHRALTNCGPTSKGVKELDNWLGDGKWDVIHFNFGLHDLKYMGPNGENLVSPDKGKQQVSMSDYEKNLQTIVKRLKKTNAKLIWRNTTPVPPGAKGRVVGHAKAYNEVAERVMKEHDVEIQDMYAFVMPRMGKIMREANVHFTPEGSKELAKTVVDQISKTLAE